MIQTITPLTKNEADESVEACRAAIKINRCIMELKTELREFIFALDIFEPVAVKEDISVLTNGKELFYSPKDVLKKDVYTLKKEILHITFHGLLGHIESGKNPMDPELAWAVMDLKVKRLMSFLYKDPGENAKEADVISVLFRKNDEEHRSDSIGMELYYRSKKNDKLRSRILDRAKNAVSDDHNAWRMVSVPGIDKMWSEAADAVKQMLEDGSGSGMDTSCDSLEELLEANARIKDLNNNRGLTAGSDSVSVSCNSEGGSDYRDLLSGLRRSCSAAYSDDYPDPMLYNYGMEMYDDILLIEPSEESEKPVIGTIAVAVDTSGSCADRLPDFFRETCTLFRELQSEVKVKNILYLECDALIQKELLLSGDEITTFFEGEHKFEGCGGTDFIPVFKRLDEYRKKEEIECLIYYSDGEGYFPDKPADFPVTFVLPDDYRNIDHHIPDWIERKYL